METRRVILCVDAAVAIGDDAARAKIRDALRDLDGADDVSRTTYDEIDDSVVAPREPPRDGFYVAVVDGEGATRAGAAAREALRAGGTCAVRVVEDVAAFAGGPVWRIDWCPKRLADGSGGAYLAVEAGGARGEGGAGGWERGEDGSEIGTGNGATMGSNHHATSFDELGRVSGAGVVQIWRLRVGAAAEEDGATTGGASHGGKRKRSGQPTRNESKYRKIAPYF